MRIAIKTLGCKVNQSESASIEGTLRENGHETVSYNDNLGTSRDRPDAYIINTCTVTAKSDYQSRQIIRKAIRTGAKVFAMGCYAQLKPEELSKINGIEAVLGNSQKNSIYEYLNKLSDNAGVNTETKPPEIFVDSPETPLRLGLPDRLPQGKAAGLDSSLAFGLPRRTVKRAEQAGMTAVAGSYYSNRARAFLKIQDGCNFSCSYCTVPLARGKSRSLCPDDVFKSVEKLCADGYKEIVITGIHIGCYGLDLEPESSLLEVVEEITGKYPDVRIRLSSIEPHEFKKEFLQLIKQGKVCPHIHIPLQSGSDRILRAMNRGYNTKFFKNLISEIIKECPGISIGTDIIAGFPGESRKDFDETLKFLEDLPLSYIHVFPYSSRPNTKAEAFPGHMNNQEKKGRVSKIIEIGKIKKKAYLLSQLGQRLDVIVEKKPVTDVYYSTISGNYIRSLVKADNLTLGQRLMVEVVSLSDGQLISRPL